MPGRATGKLPPRLSDSYSPSNSDLVHLLAVRNRLIIALDVPAAESALALARDLRDLVGAFKVGSELFTSAGPALVRELRAAGVPVFLDLKFHDIPNTVARAVTAAVGLDVQMLTVHTSGGLAMLEAAEKAALETSRKLGRPPPLVLGVTVLTSLDDAALAEVGVADRTGPQVERLARLATRAGLRGLVCSPLELSTLRTFLPPSLELVVPGIRPAGSATDDQKRTLTPRAALEAGASWLVIGRPVCAAADPRAAAQAILAELH